MGFIRLLTFFPSITFKLLPSEIFPWAGLYSLINIKRIPIQAFVIIFILIFYSLYGALKSGDLVESIRSLFAYLNVLLIFFIIINSPEQELQKYVKLARNILIFMLVLGVLQSLELIGYIKYIINYLMERGQAGNFGSGRGVSLLTTEPSRSSIEILFIYVLISNFYIKSYRKRFLIDILFFIYQLMIIKSGTGVVITFIYLAVFYTKVVFTLIFIGLLFLPVLYYYLDFLSDTSRAMYLLSKVLSFDSFKEIYGFIMSSSGNRGVSILGSYIYGFYHPFGAGIGNWKLSSIEAMSLTGIDSSSLAFFRQENNGFFQPVRVPSFIGSLIVDVGVFGVFIIFFFVRKMFLSISFKGVLKKYIIFFILYLLTISSVGNPVPFICSALFISVFSRGIE